MTDFRYYCLDAMDRIVVGDYVQAHDLPAAIYAAYAACRDHPHFPSSRIEIWRGTERLYVSAHHCAPPPS